MTSSNSSFAPLEVSAASWQYIMAGTAHRVLKGRANARRRKEQSVHDVATSEATRMLAPCELEHAKFVASVEAMRAYIEAHYLATDEALACFRDAWNASRLVGHEPCEQPDDARCCITLSAHKVVRMLLVDASHTARTHHMSLRWFTWIEACMTVGRALVWLEESVAKWITDTRPLNEHAQLTRASLEQLVASKPLLRLRGVFNNACIVLVERLKAAA